jgi:hypothetical protein
MSPVGIYCSTLDEFGMIEHLEMILAEDKPFLWTAKCSWFR